MHESICWIISLMNNLQPFSCMILPSLFLWFNLTTSVVEKYVVEPVENCLVSDVICCKAIGVDMLVRFNQISYIVTHVLSNINIVSNFLKIIWWTWSVALPSTLLVFKKTSMSNSCATRICNNIFRLIMNMKKYYFRIESKKPPQNTNSS